MQWGLAEFKKTPPQSCRHKLQKNCYKKNLRRNSNSKQSKLSFLNLRMGRTIHQLPGVFEILTKTCKFFFFEKRTSMKVSKTWKMCMQNLINAKPYQSILLSIITNSNTIRAIREIIILVHITDFDFRHTPLPQRVGHVEQNVSPALPALKAEQPGLLESVSKSW